MSSFALVMFAFGAVCLAIVLFHNVRRTGLLLGPVITVIQIFSVLLVVPTLAYLFVVLGARLGLWRTRST